MTDTTRRLAFRWAAISALIHTAVVFTASAVNNLLWGKVSFDWEAGRLLQILDFPVFWVIDRSMRQITGLPSGWPFGWRWTSVILQGSFHAVLGGAFYALLGALVALLIHRRREQRAGVAEHGAGAQETRA